MTSKKTTITPVFPEEKATISRDTEVTIGSILDSYNERGRQFAAEGIHYSPITLLTTISNLYLIKKYNTKCFMYGDRAKDENFVYGGFVFNFGERQLELPTSEIRSNDSILSQITGKNLFQINNFLDCIKQRQPIIIIPLLLQFSDSDHHANMLIYRKDLNTIEHFEPHGSYFDLRKEYGDKIIIIIQLLLDKINEINNTPGSRFFHVLPSNIRLIPSNEVCVRTRGLQAIQSQLATFHIEGAGYCQMWSLLFAEMALLNPTMGSTEILDRIYGMIGRQDGKVFLSNIIRGYVSMLGDEISLYLSEYINNAFTIENVSYICNTFFHYARYLSDVLSFVVNIEVNIDSLFPQLNLKMSQLEAYDARFQVSLSTYFRLQNELKELLVNRKRNYSSRGKDAVDAEIVEKLREEYTEYVAKRRDVKNYIQNKIFINYLINKQQMVSAAAAEKPKKATKASSAAASAVETDQTVEVPKRGRKKGGKKYKKTRKYKNGKKGKKSRKYKR
jgi:hypothetical protein